MTGSNRLPHFPGETGVAILVHLGIGLSRCAVKPGNGLRKKDIRSYVPPLRRSSATWETLLYVCNHPARKNGFDVRVRAAVPPTDIQVEM